MMLPAFVGSLFAIWIASKLRPLHHSRRVTLASLREAIVGNDLREISSVFGAPRAAAVGDGLTWYYALHHDQQLGMAISFRDGLASDVEFFQTPIQRSHLLGMIDAE